MFAARRCARTVTVRRCMNIRKRRPLMDLSTLERLKSNDQRVALQALREVLAKHLIDAEPNVSAQIAGRLQAVIVAIAALPPEVATKSKLDELRDRRANRQAG